MTTPLKFGLLGTGHWAREVHAAGLAAAPEAEFVGVWGRNAGKATEVAQRYGVRAFDDVDDLLAQVDAVSVALPPDVQAPLAAQAATAGRHLLLDKPLALSVQDADAVVRAADHAAVASRVFFTRRFQPEVETWLTEAAGTEWHGATAIWFGAINRPGNPYADSEWRKRKGALWDVGPHALALTLPVLGPVESVTAVGGLGDTVHLGLRHEGGRASTLSLSLTVPEPAARSEFRAYGTDGWATAPGGPLEAVDAYRAALAQLAGDAEQRITNHPCDVRFARQVVVVLAAAERALETRAAVDVEY